VLWGVILPSVLIESLLQAADLGLLGSPLWRGLTYQNGAFWTGLLHNWRPNYPGQAITMFLSYALLHGGIGHLLGNMLSLWLLGRRLIGRLGSWGFLQLCLISGLGGGAGFGLLSQTPHPMVGASGMLFGLAGALVWLETDERSKAGITVWPILGVVSGLAVLNVLMWLVLDGLLAWETHLGGFISGGLCMVVRSWRQDRQNKSIGF
jgi:rhomboid protease GluP